MRTNSPFSLLGKTILITGGSSGIGRSTAIECSKFGAKIIIVGRNFDRLKETYSLLKGNGHNYFVLDLINNLDVDIFVSRIPNLDGVVFNAGIQKSAPIKCIVESEFREIIETNLFSTTSLTSKLLQSKKINKNSSLVYISSTASGIVADVGNAMYSASKGAVSAFSKVLALELSTKRIRVNSIMPAMVDTNFHKSIDVDITQINSDKQRYPFGYGKPEDVAYTVIFLLSDASKWMTGASLLLDGGLTLK
jgi:NAD(P)-dependent dehydrogenase (short-subunit alcohol dehydrogenase family)